MTVTQYSSFFSTLYDEQIPVGKLGRGTHYSVLRTAEWHDVCLCPVPTAQVHDFAVIWDEDHDDRVVTAIERMYFSGLLAPVQFVGERKAFFTVILASKCYFNFSDQERKAYISRVEQIASNVQGDHWDVEVGYYDRAGPDHQTDVSMIIADRGSKVDTYLRNIDNLWDLGTKKYIPPTDIFLSPPPIPVFGTTG